MKGVVTASRSSRGDSGSIRRDVLELLAALGLVLLVLWTPRPWQLASGSIAAAAILVLTCVSFDGFKRMGLGTTNLLPSLWAIPASLILAGAAVVLAGTLHTLRLPGSMALFAKDFGAYALWSFFQQLLLQCYALSRLVRLFSQTNYAAAMAGLLFAIAHLPSPILTILTLILGLAASLFFLRYRNLYPLSIAHAILGTAIAITVPGPVDHNMQVGLSYLNYGKGTHSIAYAQRHPSTQPH